MTEKPCEVCEQETGCVYIAEGYDTVCCKDNADIETNKYCNECRAEYLADMVDNAYDEYKYRHLEGRK